MFLWCRLPDGLDDADLARRALAENIILAPGRVFSPSGGSQGFLRFNVAQSLDARMWRGLETVLGAVG
jgi:DNA-binding transcriptional MocR family regulator